MPRAEGGHIKLLGTAVSRRALFLMAVAASLIIVCQVAAMRLMGNYDVKPWIIMVLGGISIFLNSVCFVVETCAPTTFESQWKLGLIGTLVWLLGGACLVILFVNAIETVGLVAASLGLFISGGLILKETNVVKGKLAKSGVFSAKDEVRNGGFGVGLVCSLIMYVTVSGIILSENIGPKFLTLQEFNPIDSFRLAAVIAGFLCLVASTFAIFYGDKSRLVKDKELRFYHWMTCILLSCAAIFPTLSGTRINSMFISLFAATCCSASIAKDVYFQKNKSSKRHRTVG